MFSNLFGRRVHIAGSVYKNADAAEAKRARQFVQALVKQLLKKGATFVLPVDADPKREDQVPCCFDWLVWTTIKDNLHLRPHGAPTPVVVAVKHYKNDEQIPEEHFGWWDSFSASDQVRIDSAAHWKMNAKRMEVQAKHGDMLIAIGGGEGILFLANAYHDAGKPVIPVNYNLALPNSGTAKICEYASNDVAVAAARLFRTTDGNPALTWLSRLAPTTRTDVAQTVERVMLLLEALERPSAFAVRLLNPKFDEYESVENFFETVAKPVVEAEYGYILKVVDGKQAVEEARIDQDIFVKLRRSGMVIADLTAVRPNCFLELGYALGRGAHTIVTAREGTELPFDVTTYSSHIWKSAGNVEFRRAEFRQHLESVKGRPSIVGDSALIP